MIFKGNQMIYMYMWNYEITAFAFSQNSNHSPPLKVQKIITILPKWALKLFPNFTRHHLITHAIYLFNNTHIKRET